MAMPLPTQSTEWIKMGSLVVRPELNHRSHRSLDRINQYAQMLDNGENPPPIKVCRKTNIIIGGIHRFFSARRFHESRDRVWQDQPIEVQWVADAPNPETDPVHFILMTAVENRHNGEPLNPRDIHRLLIRTIQTHGKEEAKKYAPLLNETPETVERLWRMITPPVAPPVEPRPETGHYLPTTADQAIIRDAQMQIEPEADVLSPKPIVPEVEQEEPDPPRRPMPIAPGNTRSYRPPIMAACRNLGQAIKDAKGDFTDAERGELEDIYRVLGAVLNK